jgi:hypothetical protein
MGPLILFCVASAGALAAALASNVRERRIDLPAVYDDDTYTGPRPTK